MSTANIDIHPVDKAYIAGFIDGEGCITLSRVKGRTNWVHRIIIVNRDYSVLQWVMEFYGGRIYQLKKRSVRYAPTFALTICRKANIQFILHDIMPFLRLKKLQAKNMLAFLSLSPISKTPLNNGKRGCAFSYSQDDIDNKDAFVAIQQSLNKKGPTI